MKSLCLTLIALFVLVAVASFFPAHRLWGFNHLAFYPLPVRLFALAIVAVAFHPAVSRLVHFGLARALSSIRASRKMQIGLILIVPLAAVAVFFLFQSATLLLGDGQLIANEFEHTLGERYTAFRFDFDTLVMEHRDAKGSTLLYYGAGFITSRFLGLSPVAGIRALNCVLGGLLILLLLLIILRARLSESLSVWLVFLVLTSGAMQLFFGYVENYPPVVFFAYLYLAGGMVFVHTMRASWFAATLICLVAAIAMHLLGSLLLPSFGLLAVWALLKNRRPKILPHMTCLLASLFLVGTYLLARLTDYGEHFLPLTANERIYGVLTPSHWADIVNELLLILPTLPLFVVMFVLAGRRTRKHPESETEHPSDSKAFNSRVEWYWSLLIALPCLAFLIVFKTEIGMARDWDLLSITIVGLLPLALLLLNRTLLRSGRTWTSAITTPALVLSGVLAIAWIGINASPDRSASRYESILEYDKTWAAYAYEALAKHYYEAGQYDQAVAAMEKGTEGSDNLRLQALLVVYYVDAGRTDEAIDLLKHILTVQPLYDRGRSQLCLLLDRAGRYDDLLPVALDGTRYHPGQSLYHYFYGKALVETGSAGRGAHELLEAERLGPPAVIASDLRRLLKRLRENGILSAPGNPGQ
jgi:hypothetical protein